MTHNRIDPPDLAPGECGPCAVGEHGIITNTGHCLCCGAKVRDFAATP